MCIKKWVEQSSSNTCPCHGNPNIGHFKSLMDWRPSPNTSSLPNFDHGTYIHIYIFLCVCVRVYIYISVCVCVSIYIYTSYGNQTWFAGKYPIWFDDFPSGKVPYFYRGFSSHGWWHRRVFEASHPGGSPKSTNSLTQNKVIWGIDSLPTRDAK